jgi:hypothetical protein
VDEETKRVIDELRDRVETLELAVSGLLPDQPDPLEANHVAFVAGPVAAARERERTA